MNEIEKYYKLKWKASGELLNEISSISIWTEDPLSSKYTIA